MSGHFSVYRIQGILTLLQTCLIIGGSLLTRAILKVFGYPEVSWGVKAFPVFVRDWWLLLILVPVAWCFTSIWSEERSHWFSQRMTLITGMALLVLTGLAMLLSVYDAAHWRYS